jgi:hypothetical protein
MYRIVCKSLLTDFVGYGDYVLDYPMALAWVEKLNKEYEHEFTHWIEMDPCPCVEPSS